ncbi:HAMP domain-containing histidine kinase [Patescibacteria group bacterium]|nr:HAMP domain-containing histidine kinase [Patescibacteria group bacterium]
MFQKAVLRLTLWYLAVITLLSVAFTVALYQVSTRELNTLEQRQQTVQQSIIQLQLPPSFTALNQQRIEQIEESKQNIAINLAYFNIVIILAGGAISYFLAKQTLQPIEESVEAQNRFTADASHELRTPLTVMRTEIEVALRDGNFNLEESKQLHESTLEEIGKLETLTNNLLQLSKQDSASQRAAFRLCALEDIAAEGVNRVKPQLKKHRDTVETHLERGEVLGDPWSLAELVAILLDNAIKYSPEKSVITLATQVEHQHAVITVADRGIGISPEDMPHIFDRFYRADLSRTKGKQRDGYGLGLSLAKKIADTHHGVIEVHSTLGSGSTFTVRLPLGHK